MYTLTYYDSTKNATQTETFGMPHCINAFAQTLSEKKCYRIMETWDVYKNKSFNLAEKDK